MSKLQALTPLKISLISDEQIGTGRDEGKEILPYTPYLHSKLNLEGAFLPIKEAIDVPESLLTDLRPYQQEDVKILANRLSAANFSEPRTGKTPTALRAFKAKRLNKIIIVCPASAVYQWEEEFLKWYEEPAVALTAKTPQSRKEQIIKEEWGNTIAAIIVSYDLLKMVMRNDKPSGLLELILKYGKHTDGIIVDEAHRIRNHKSLQAQAIFSLSGIPNKLILTGTPAHGALKDLYSLLHFLYPKIFTGYWRFINYYFETQEIKLYKKQISFIDIVGLKNEQELAQFIDRIGVQHKRKEVMKWLPDKDYIEIKLPLTKLQKKYIDELEDMFETNHIIVENVLTQLLRIRQIANSPSLLDLEGSSPKTEWLKQYVADNPEKSIIVFSGFTQYINELSLALGLPYKITGETSAKTRNELKHRFQSGKIKVLLINTQAGKEALTLDRAEVAIFLDIYPPYGDIDQAENRFTATTEEGKDKEHTIINVMMKNSYDEQLFSLVKERASETAIINNYKQHLEERRSNVKTKGTTKDPKTVR